MFPCRLDQQDGRKCTTAGIVLPYGNGFLISGVSFYNFDRVECAGFEFARVIGTCSVYCGGFTYHTKGLRWENSVNKVSDKLLSQLVGEGGEDRAVA